MAVSVEKKGRLSNLLVYGFLVIMVFGIVSIPSVQAFFRSVLKEPRPADTSAPIPKLR